MEEAIIIFDSLDENIPPPDCKAPTTNDPIPQPSKRIDDENLKSRSHSIKFSRMNKNDSKNSQGPIRTSVDSIQVFSPKESFQHHSPGSKNFGNGTIHQDTNKSPGKKYHRHSTSMANLPNEAKIVTIDFAAGPVIFHSEKNVAGQFNIKNSNQQSSGGHQSSQKFPSEAGRTGRFGPSRNQASNASQGRQSPDPNRHVYLTNSRTPDP